MGETKALEITMRSSSPSIAQWSAFGLATLVAGLFWAVDVQGYLMSLRPEKIIWFPVAVLWLEIAIVIAALIRRHVAGIPAVGRSSILLAWGAAAVNVAFMLMVGLSSPIA